MNEKSHTGIATLVTAVIMAGYFGLYALSAHYIDFGDEAPAYLVQYRIGSLSLDRMAGLFEPARRIDDLFFRHKHGVVMERRSD